MTKKTITILLLLLATGQSLYTNKNKRKIRRVIQVPGYVTAQQSMPQPAIMQPVITQPLIQHPQQTIIEIDIDEKKKDKCCCGFSKKACCVATSGGMCCCVCLFVVAGIIGAVCGSGNCG